jgi:hypothetical protein
MSKNLSLEQFGRYEQSVTKMGAMPRNPKFDDPQPAKPVSTEDQFAPNKSIPIAKPGFF